MYVILTSKPGQFRTEPGPAFRLIEAHDYLFCQRLRARFVIAEVTEPARVRLVDETEPVTVNDVPAKFLPKFETLERARQELRQLCRPGNADAELRPSALVSSPSSAGATASIRVTFITNDHKVVEAPANSNLLRVSLREKGGIPFKCGGGLCGTCKCRIEHGREHTDAVKPKERKHLTEAQLAEGYRMACQTLLQGDVAVSW